MLHDTMHDLHAFDKPCWTQPEFPAGYDKGFLAAMHTFGMHQTCQVPVLGALWRSISLHMQASTTDNVGAVSEQLEASSLKTS